MATITPRDDVQGALTKKYFRRYRSPRVALPDLIKPQRESFSWLIEDGFKEVLKEFSPISDYSGKKFELHFKKYVVGAPKCSPERAKETSSPTMRRCV